MEGFQEEAGWELWWEGCSRQRGQHVQRFRDQAAFYSFGGTESRLIWVESGPGRQGLGFNIRDYTETKETPG